MRGLVLVGAGAHGRGTLEIVRAMFAAGRDDLSVAGFVDDDEQHSGRSVGGFPVLGRVAWLEQRAGDEIAVVLAVAGSRAKQALAERLDRAGVSWAPPIVHPSAVIAQGTTLAAGAIVNAGVAIAYDTELGPHTTVNLNATIGHDCLVAAYSTIAPGVNITGGVKLGQGVEIQTNATIVPGLTIGAWSRVGPGSVVLRDVAPGESVFGNPARRVPSTGG